MDLPTDSSSGSDIYLTNTNERQNETQSMAFSEQSGATSSKQIQIKYQPRRFYHPRTQKESEKVAHYIRCEEGKEQQYPAIHLPPAWANMPKDNFIEVALMDIKNRPHPYIIENKERDSSEGQILIYRGLDNASNILYFRLIDEDFTKMFKTFQIELIKSKQGNGITKKMIRERELEKSKLRFTYTFYDNNDNYHRDEGSTVYSNVMIENYGDVAVKHINPQFGPMGGDQLLDVVFTGLKAEYKKKLSFEIIEKTINWSYKIRNFDSTGSTIHFPMPAFPDSRMKVAQADVIVYHEDKEIFKSSFVYTADLDLILDKLNKPIQDDTGSTTTSSGYGPSEDRASDSCSSSVVPKKTSKKYSKKRQREE